MSLELTGVHVYEKVPGTSHEMRLVRTNPYVRIASGDGPPLYVQGGRIYSEGGPEVGDLPGWWTEEIAKLTPAVRAEVGLKDTEKKASPPVVKLPATWTCPDQATCQQKMPIPLQRKGLHVAKFHRRRVEPAGSV